MSLIEKHHKTFIVLFLELLSLSPILMILGNVVPPFPLKVHFITFGITFLLICLFLSQYRSKKWLIYVAIIYFLLQFFLSGFHLKDFIDFFFGPFVFISMFDIYINGRVSKDTLFKYKKRFFILMWIPMSISLLQYFGISPLTFWNATYINYSRVDGIETPRPNGFLYHGSELSIIIFFVAIKQLIKSNRFFIFQGLIILLIAYGTYYKALTATILLLVIYYYTIIHPVKGFQWTSIIFKNEKKIYQAILSIFIIGVLILVYKLTFLNQKEIFDPQLLTGRGSLWNVYLQAIKNFSFFEWLFGAGIGSEAILFKQFATPELYYPLKVDPSIDLAPDGHNAILSTFLNVGIIGSLLYVFLFKIVHSQISNLKKMIKEKAIFFLIFVIAIFTLGITIPIFKNAIFWIALSFTIHYWFLIAKNYGLDD
jgi:hypothetical protein